MAQVPYTSFYNGPFAVYNSPSGMISQVTGIPYLGDTLHEGDYCDLSAKEAANWNTQYGSNLFPGRYRFVMLSPNAVAADLAFGAPIGFGLGTTVAQAIVSAAGSGYTITATGASSGTVSISSSTSGGTAVATANLTLSGGAITGAQLTYPGAGFTSVPTFTLSSVLSSGSTGSVLARMFASPNFVSSFDSSTANQISVPRGVILCAPTSAQISAGAWVVIQEQGIANVLVTTATATASGSVATAASGGAVTTTTSATAPVAGFLGYTIDLAAASTITRVLLGLPVQQG